MVATRSSSRLTRSQRASRQSESKVNLVGDDGSRVTPRSTSATKPTRGQRVAPRRKASPAPKQATRTRSRRASAESLSRKPPTASRGSRGSSRVARAQPARASRAKSATSPSASARRRRGARRQSPATTAKPSRSRRASPRARLSRPPTRSRPSRSPSSKGSRSGRPQASSKERGVRGAGRKASSPARLSRAQSRGSRRVHKDGSESRTREDSSEAEDGDSSGDGEFSDDTSSDVDITEHTTLSHARAGLPPAERVPPSQTTTVYSQPTPEIIALSPPEAGLPLRPWDTPPDRAQGAPLEREAVKGADALQMPLEMNDSDAQPLRSSSPSPPTQLSVSQRSPSPAIVSGARRSSLRVQTVEGDAPGGLPRRLGGVKPAPVSISGMKRHCAKFSSSDDSMASASLGITMLSHALAFVLYRDFFVLAIAVEVIALLRWWAIFKDAALGSFAVSDQANRQIGLLVGAIVGVPFDIWYVPHLLAFHLHRWPCALTILHPLQYSRQEATQHYRSFGLLRKDPWDTVPFVQSQWEHWGILRKLASRLLYSPTVRLILGPISRSIRYMWLRDPWVILGHVGRCWAVHLGMRWHVLAAPIVASIVHGAIHHITHASNPGFRANSRHWSSVEANARGAAWLCLPFGMESVLLGLSCPAVKHIDTSVPCYKVSACAQSASPGLFRHAAKVGLVGGLPALFHSYWDERDGLFKPMTLWL